MLGLITVITPSYNQGKYIEETIQSVLSQDYPDIEYIVIDGGSTDKTVEVLKKYDNFIKWVSEPDNGQTAAINKGLKVAGGDIVAYLNSDDLYEPGTLSTVAEFFRQNKDIAMVYGDTIHINEQSLPLETHRTGEIDLRKYLMWDFYLPQPSVFFRKEVIDSLGYFDERLHLAMDYDYWIRIILNYPTVYIPKVFSRIRIYPEAKSRAMDYRYHNERLAILNSIFRAYNLEQYRKDAYSYTYFSAALIFMKRHYNREAVRNFNIARRIDPRYLIHPYLYWAFLEMAIGEKYAHRLKTQLKKFSGKGTYSESLNIIK